MRDFVLVGKDSCALWYLCHELKPSIVITEKKPYSNKFLLKKVLSLHPLTIIANWYLGHKYNKTWKLNHLTPHTPLHIEVDKVTPELVRGKRVCIYGSSIIKKKTIDACKEIVNLHLGWLPDFKGCKPEVWALATGGIIGVSLHRVTPYIDDGDILFRDIATPKGLTITKVRLLKRGVSLVKSWLDNEPYKIIKNEGGAYYSTPPYDVIIEAYKNSKVTPSIS